MSTTTTTTKALMQAPKHSHSISITVPNGINCFSELNLKIDFESLSMKLSPENVALAVQRLKTGLNLKVKDLSKGEKSTKNCLLILDKDQMFIDFWNKKNKKILTLFLRDITEVLTKTPVLEGGAFKSIFTGKTVSDENLSFTIRFGKGELQFVCASQEEYDICMLGLYHLVTGAYLAFEQDATKQVVRRYWMKADRNEDNKLSKTELSKVLQVLNISADRHKLNNLFKMADKDNSGYLSYYEFDLLYNALMEKPELDFLYNNYSTDGTMLLEDFLKFLHQEQHETRTTLDEAKEIMRMNNSIITKMGQSLNKHHFTRYLFGSGNTLANPHLYTNDQDMAKPLNHYYIASSHNTYLTGHQLHGDSSVEMYKKVLCSGCRCVELDCWDGNNGEPAIFHGHTLTSKIKFKDVVQCIAQYAFVASAYPVILSLEMHCSVAQQDKIAEYLMEAFGESLVLPAEMEKLETLPSPESLKKRVLVKGKRIASQSDTYDEEEDEETDEITTDSGDQDLLDEEYVKYKEEVKKTLHEKRKISQKLSDITALQSVSFKSPLTKSDAYKMYSFSENRIQRFAKHLNDYMALMAYNMHQLSRIYPKGTRFGSSNYDPTPAWNAGCQLVALNYQTNCRFMRMNAIKFAENGGTGYILKPLFLRDPQQSLNIFELHKPQYHFEINIICGEALPKPQQSDKGEVVDPFVKLQVCGIPRDSSVKHVTQTIWNNGFNPIWQERVEFDIYCIELAYLRVAVYDKNKTKKDIFLCENVVPMKEIRRGYRNLPMRNEHGNMIQCASLLMHIDFKHL